MPTEEYYNQKEYDYVIIGAGIFGLYAAEKLARKGRSVLMIEKTNLPLNAGSYVNQARLHKGYHYPRSVATAQKTIQYFEKFSRDFDFAINKEFSKIYAISSVFSHTNAASYKKFCSNIGVECEEIDSSKYFNEGFVEAAFKTHEYSYDAIKIREYFLSELSKYEKADISLNTIVKKAIIKNDKYFLRLNTGEKILTPNVLNLTYAGINEVLKVFGYEYFPIKYEYCEVIICDVSNNIKNIGLTVMDGPFFSLMPFGLSKNHSLTSVSFTPHKSSKADLPDFKFLKPNNKGVKQSRKPATAWKYMSQLAKKYLVPEISYNYKESLYTLKPVLQSSEVDDSRPTVIVQANKSPNFTSVLSGKMSTIYDLDEILI
ncbi:FAD-binding oxidoreductase [Candidatus Dojkabacteria bacterium]|nr:FAD-binding oxidoreductase [Candidatus Dojkabacteria bacterium]